MSLSKLHPQLQAYVKEKWKGLTEIQLKAFDPIFNGQSCTVEAPTSGGKTEAVLFPLLSRIKPDKTAGFKVLYIAPLKALLNDLALRVMPYSEKCYMKAFKWHGDVSQAEKIKQMIFPADILLTTPESIEAILLRKANWEEVFANLETVVIDEAHHFALSERGSHLVSLLERIDKQIGRLPQRIAVTATVGNGNELLRWIVGKRTNSVNIKVDGKTEKQKDFLVQYFNDEEASLYRTLYHVLAKKKSIVFERSRSKTEEAATKMNEWNNANGSRNPVKVATHHSSVSKRLREEAEYSIKQSSESSVDAIISTSTLELGIDIGDLDQVVQVGGLNSSGSFLQRVGRTGRREGKPQYFRGFCSDEEELILLSACVSLGLRRISEDILFPKKAFHILAHQVICLCLQKLGTTADEIWSTVKDAYCFSEIRRDEFDQLLQYMIEQDYLRDAGRNALMTSNKTEEEFLRMNWQRLFAIFETGPMYNVVDGKKIIGTLDSSFARNQKIPFVFVLGGQEWNTIKLDHEMQQVRVEKNKTGIAPKWKALSSHDIPFELAHEVGRLLMNDDNLHFLDAEAEKVLRRHRNIFQAIGWTKKKWILELEGEEGLLFLWTFCGDKINRAIALQFETDFGEEPEYDFRNIRLRRSGNKSLGKEEVLDWLSHLKQQNEREIENELLATIDVKWFSKFSQCLPEQLAKKTILEKGIDLQGLKRELNTVDIQTDWH
jgi:ATP-dependent helicase Lhr and Lhr-like helicase